MANSTVDKSIRDYVSKALAEISSRPTQVLWLEDKDIGEIFVEEFCEEAIHLAELAARWEDKTIILQTMAKICDELAITAGLVAGRGAANIMRTYAYLLWQGPPDPKCDATDPRFDPMFADLVRSLPLAVLSLCESSDGQFSRRLNQAKSVIELLLNQQD